MAHSWLAAPSPEEMQMKGEKESENKLHGNYSLVFCLFPLYNFGLLGKRKELRRRQNQRHRNKCTVSRSLFLYGVESEKGRRASERAHLWIKKTLREFRSIHPQIRFRAFAFLHSKISVFYVETVRSYSKRYSGVVL